MKKLITAVAVAALSMTVFGATTDTTKTVEQQYAEAKASGKYDIARKLAFNTTNEIWKAELNNIASNIYATSTANNVTYQEYFLVFHHINRLDRDTKRALFKQWVNLNYLAANDRYVCKVVIKYHMNRNVYEGVYAKTSAKNKIYLITCCDDIHHATPNEIIDADPTCTAMTNVDVKTIQKYLNMLNRIEVSYRQSDVRNVLNNMNAKFTMKMYEDGKEETYKPIVTKIRALLEVR